MSKSILLAIATVTILNGCAVYTVANGLAWVTTDKSITDHTSSALVKADCDAVRMAVQGTYYCEYHDISTTYNRTGY